MVQILLVFTNIYCFLFSQNNLVKRLVYQEQTQDKLELIEILIERTGKKYIFYFNKDNIQTTIETDLDLNTIDYKKVDQLTNEIILEGDHIVVYGPLNILRDLLNVEDQ